jgi:hypothetical protein
MNHIGNKTDDDGALPEKARAILRKMKEGV